MTFSTCCLRHTRSWQLVLGFRVEHVGYLKFPGYRLIVLIRDANGSISEELLKLNVMQVIKQKWFYIDATGLKSTKSNGSLSPRTTVLPTTLTRHYS